MKSKLQSRHNLSVGFTLTELLIAMALGLGLVAGALHGYSLVLNAWRTIEAAAALEERLTFALRAIEDDVLLAGYRGESHLPGPAMPTAAHCRGRDVSAWALAISDSLEAHNNVTSLPCPAYAGFQFGSDALVLRHHDAMSETLVIKMHAWYIDRSSSSPGEPSLRRHTLLPDGSVQNHEIMPGIESMQILLGMDHDGDREVDAYMQPGRETGTLLAVHVELAARSALREQSLAGDGYRRRTAERLFLLRNV